MNPTLTLELEPVEAACRVDLHLDDTQAADMAALFKALSHTVRLQMVDIIAQGGDETCVCHIEAYFNLTQPTISHHLKILREAGLITSEAQGVWVHHRLNRERLQAVQAWLDYFR